MELPWSNGSPIQRDCLCSNKSLPMTVKSLSNIVEVHFTVKSMNSLDDYNNIFFEGTWDFVKAVPCLQKRRVRGPSGEIKFESPITDEQEVKKLFILYYQSFAKSRKNYSFLFFIFRKIVKITRG